MTIDELSRRAELPVRTLREYHTMRLLPPSVRRGRVGVYGVRHLQRLELIARLQRRGYSLAGIRDLLRAWDAGTDLTTLLGVDSGPAGIDEMPMRLTRTELDARLPGLDEVELRQAIDSGLVRPDGAEHVVVRSPALLALVADGLRAGVGLGEMLEVIGVMMGELERMADVVAGLIVERIWEPRVGTAPPDEAAVAAVAGLLQRGRLLLLQGVASSLADRLGTELLRRTDTALGGRSLRAAIERVRIGVVTDSAGTIQARSAS